jgi:hypothetical protein
MVLAVPLRDIMAYKKVRGGTGQQQRGTYTLAQRMPHMSKQMAFVLLQQLPLATWQLVAKPWR